MATKIKPELKGYLKLVEAFPLRPIRTEAELDEASGIAGRLAGRRDLTAAEEDYLELLSRLIEDYADEHYPPKVVSGVEMLRYAIEQAGTTQTALAAATGISASVLSEILSGKRGFTRKHIEALAKHFKVSPAVFLPRTED